MSKKNIIFCSLNIFFIVLLAYAVWLFSKPFWSFNAAKIVQNSTLKERILTPDIIAINSPEGYNAWFVEDHNASLASLHFYFDRSGYAYDAPKKEGLSYMVAQLLLRGAGQYNEEEYLSILELNGVKLDFSVSDETFDVAMTAPVQNLDMAAKLLNEALTKPRFSFEDINLVKTQIIEIAKTDAENPQKVLNKAFKKAFFGTHPKARGAKGNKESVQNITRRDLISFVGTHFAKDNLTIALVGDLSLEDAENFLSKVFSNLPSKFQKVTDLEALMPNYDIKEQNIERDMPQVLAKFVARAPKRLDEDFYALYMANEIFGGSGLSSRLNLMAREKKGLTYGAYTYLNPVKDAPRIEGSFATSKENEEKMREILFNEWQKMADFGVSQGEFDAIRQNMLTSFNLRFKSISDIAAQILYMQKEHLGIDFFKKRNDYVKNITLEDVNAAAKKYFSNPPAVITIGGNNFKE